MKKLLMIVVLGMLFISCDQYTAQPLTTVETYELSLQTDTTQYVVVTSSDENTTYFKVTEDGMVPEVKLFEPQKALPIIISIILAFLFFMAGWSVGQD